MRTAASIVPLVILVPATVVVLLVSSLRMNVLTPQFLKHELSARNAYTIAENQASEQIGKMNFENLPINAADLQALIRRVLPASWLQQNIETILDRLFAWFNGPATMTLSIPIDLRGPKAELIPGVDALIQSAIPRLPECARNSATDELCRTPNMTVAQVKDVLKLGGIDLATVTSQLPDSFDLANPVLPEIKLGNNDQSSGQQQSSQTNTQQNNKGVTKQDQKKIDEQQKRAGQASADSVQPKKTFQQQASETVDKLTAIKSQFHRWLRIWLYALIGYATVILGYLAINFKGWKRLTRWAGILLLTIGALPLVIGIASFIVLEKYGIPNIHFNADTPVDVTTAAIAAIRDVQHAMFFPILITGGALVVLGLGGVIGAHWIAQPAWERSEQ